MKTKCNETFESGVIIDELATKTYPVESISFVCVRNMTNNFYYELTIGFGVNNKHKRRIIAKYFFRILGYLLASKSLLTIFCFVPVNTGPFYRFSDYIVLVDF